MKITMQLTTPVPITPLQPAINYESSLVFLGSCFTENIGSKMAYHGFKTCVNPFGIIFNPHSLLVLLERSLSSDLFTLEDVETHFSYLAHSDLNGSTRDAVLNNLNTAGTLLTQQIKKASHVFITLGTAWVYEHIEQQSIVANCHKQPQGLFVKKLLSINEISKKLSDIISIIKNAKHDITVTFTLSPVRHIKDGFTENQRSKARLFEAIQAVVETQKAQYFPAYEIVMDELRDYRFYGRDMIHLNETGIELVWERFRESVISTTCSPIMKAVDKHRKLIAHRPSNVDLHLEQIEKSLISLQQKYPQVKL
ncbi:GSCFA domain-containing protein [Nonlabens ulvanivorans]|uniref:GSCFA domain-containing protein n=5 Tax=Nonlabens ulvanivorans TaxID=906888 RepID=UPI00326445BA